MWFLTPDKCEISFHTLLKGWGLETDRWNNQYSGRKLPPWYRVRFHQWPTSFLYLTDAGIDFHYTTMNGWEENMPEGNTNHEWNWNCMNGVNFEIKSIFLGLNLEKNQNLIFWKLDNTETIPEPWIAFNQKSARPNFYGMVNFRLRYIDQTEFSFLKSIQKPKRLNYRIEKPFSKWFRFNTHRVGC